MRKFSTRPISVLGLPLSIALSVMFAQPLAAEEANGEQQEQASGWFSRGAARALVANASPPVSAGEVTAKSFVDILIPEPAEDRPASLKRTEAKWGLTKRQQPKFIGAMPGVNALYDYEWPYSHARFALGADVRSGHPEANSNPYSALSGRFQIASTTHERPFDSYEAYRRLALRIRPELPFEIEAGVQDDNIADSAYFVLFRVRLALGRPEPRKRPPAYSLADVRAGTAQVPRTFLAGLPATALQNAESGSRKDIFVRTILPLILRSNEAIQADRARLLGLSERRGAGEPSSRKERTWLSNLAARYGEESADLTILARRVDVIPPALALAQAAVESGWGTSRFAREGNALFGIRSFDGAPALVPKERDSNARFAVRRYNRLADSVRVYMHTLNTHWAYHEFRGVRAASRARGRAIDAKDLLPTLESYAENPGYIGLLVSVMRTGRFRELDQAALANH